MTALQIIGALFISTFTSVADGMMIEGKEMTIDEAIIKAGANGSMTKMFELFQSKKMVMVELDMVFKLETYMRMRKEMEASEAADGSRSSRKKRKATTTMAKRWTGKRVPYEITNELSYDEKQKIREAIDDYHRYTCVRFVKARSQKNKVKFQNGGGCSSFVGMVGGTQSIRLASGCRHKGIIIHEIGHAIGFNHEQTRPDRDRYVRILSNNIQRGVAYNFMKYTSDQVSGYGVPYDYSSVMHYGAKAFSRNGKPTIVAVDPQYQDVMGNRDGLSYRDIELANKIYDCAEANRCPKTPCAQGFRGKNCKCWCDSGDRSKPLVECGRSVVRPSVTTTRRPATTRSPFRCSDKSRSCSGWVTKGYCRGKYEPYMRENCQRSCNYCGYVATPRPTPPIANCEDNNQYCNQWARAGECHRNPSYMMRNCKRSCNFCNSGISECRDSNRNCASWSRYCNYREHRDYLSMNCMRTCNTCTLKDPLPKEVTTPKAEPIIADCKDSENKNYCNKFSSIKCTGKRYEMVRYRCAKTCNACGI